ncbi:MAG TPA: biotin transporter BioY [Synergistaceae bacterium]|nr:biotin transporter BioY [Synergistaceae bacterium]
MHAKETRRFMILAALFAVLTAVGAWIRIPFPLVPLTLQVFFVLLSGILLGPFWGPVSQGLYLFLGFLGLPVLAGAASGPGILFLPTFGFLLGFIGASWIAGWYSFRRGVRENVSFRNYAVASLLGIGVIYFFGLLGLYWNLNYLGGKEISLLQVCRIGFLPFIAGDLLKAAGATLLAQRVGVRLQSLGYLGG